MDKTIVKVISKLHKGISEFFASPEISAICQQHPITASIAAYLGGEYAQEQYQTLNDFIQLLHTKVNKIEANSINKEFLETSQGKRIIGKVFKAVLRDNRIEKIRAMTNLTVNLYKNKQLSMDEKELYVDILDTLNTLQLSILQKGIIDMRKRTEIRHKGLGWEDLQPVYEKIGISKALLLQSIRTLESNGLINENSATVITHDQTHFITDFGEQFYDFISDETEVKNDYLSL